MAATFRLDIVTPERVVYSGQVESLVAPGVEGYFGILARHAPFIAALRSGALRIRTEEGESLLLAISGGFFEVSQNKAVVLADAAEFAAEIDVERAQAALERARRRLRGEILSEAERQRAERAMERAHTRIRVAAQSRAQI
ncbi:MAG TPA: F0F1 ATP synthase subunit epsilon [Armatimonadetes bacterium]|nr:F0F1 ATP synthase subunit epsilon [Armatimonadota bacterium]